MTKFPKVAMAILGTGALVGALLTQALASQSPPLKPLIRTAAKKFSVNGDLTITGVLRVNKNNSVYGKFYAHGGAQVWQGLLIHSGVLKTDALQVTGAGPALFQAASVTGNLQAGAITGTTLSTTGAATIGGKLTANGLDGGAGGLTTTGAISGASLTTTGNITATGSLTAASITDNGTFSVASLTTGAITASGNISTTGTLTAGATSVTNLTPTGTVDFSHATVTGLSLGGIGSNFSSLTVGTAAATNSPLVIAENSQQATIGVNSSGALTVGTLSTTGNLAVAGNESITGTLGVAGTGGITANTLVAPTPSGQSQSPLALQGNGINLSGNTTLVGGSDLGFSTSSTVTGVASHIVANMDNDVAGQVTFNIPASSITATTQTVGFTRSFATVPVITLTAAGDPSPATRFSGTPPIAPPKVWVTLSGTGPYTGFVINYVPPSAPTSSFQVTFNYTVIGS